MNNNKKLILTAWILICYVQIELFSEYNWYCSEVKSFGFINIIFSKCALIDMFVILIMFLILCTITNNSIKTIFYSLSIFILFIALIKFINLNFHIDYFDILIGDIAKFISLFIIYILLKILKKIGVRS
mgnify:CR=1 FL=1|jgi:hypothetical protein